jgi:hypothetical protein
MKTISIKFRPKTIKRNELHFRTQLTTRGVVHKDKTKYNRQRDRAIKGEK